MSDRKKSDCGYALALILLGLGRTQQAVHWLEQAFEQGSVWSLGYRGDPILQPLRGEPRFEALLRKIGQKRDKLTIVQAGFQPAPTRRPHEPRANRERSTPLDSLPRIPIFPTSTATT